jgi:hypothetical protein
VPYFKDADELYGLIGRLFTELAADAELAEESRSADTIVQYRYTDPEAQVTVDMRSGHESHVDCGETGMEPQIVMTMPADVAHEFWLGRVNVTIALARGQMTADGPVAKILKLLPLTETLFPRYRALLEAAGRPDLVGA